MAEDQTYYSQFEGEDVGGKRYGLGDPIDEAVPLGVLSILAGMGRISTTKPAASEVIIPVTGEVKPVANMNRAELEAAAMHAMGSRIASADDDQLREAVTRHRAEESGEREGSDEDKAAADEKPLARQNTAELTATAEREGVTFGEDVKTNPDRVAAIEAARKARDAG